MSLDGIRNERAIPAPVFCPYGAKEPSGGAFEMIRALLGGPFGARTGGAAKPGRESTLSAATTRSLTLTACLNGRD